MRKPVKNSEIFSKEIFYKKVRVGNGSTPSTIHGESGGCVDVIGEEKNNGLEYAIVILFGIGQYCLSQFFLDNLVSSPRDLYYV